MSKLGDLRKMYSKLGDREMPDGLREGIYQMIKHHREEGFTVVTNQERKTPRLFKRMGAPIASGIAVIVALGIVTDVLAHSELVIPVLGGYQKSVELSQVPDHVRWSIEAIESFDNSMKPNMATQLTETRANVVSKSVYHIELIGNFPIQQSLPHRTGQKFPQITRLMLSIPADDSYVSLQGYADSKMVYEKQRLPVVNKHWVFSGSNSLWQATYTVDSSAVEFPQYDYAQTTTSHYVLRYLGKNSSAIGRFSYKFSFPQSEFSDKRTKLPSSGVISQGSGQGGRLGALTDYSGEHGTLKVSWDNKNAVIPLNMSKQSNGST